MAFADDDTRFIASWFMSSFLCQFWLPPQNICIFKCRWNFTACFAGSYPHWSSKRSATRGLFKWNWLPIATFFESTSEVSKVQKRTAVVIEPTVEIESDESDESNKLFIWKLLTRLRRKTPPRLGHLAPASEVVRGLIVPFYNLQTMPFLKW
jgi:hypothetical protein